MIEYIHMYTHTHTHTHTHTLQHNSHTHTTQHNTHTEHRTHTQNTRTQNTHTENTSWHWQEAWCAAFDDPSEFGASELLRQWQQRGLRLRRGLRWPRWLRRLGIIVPAQRAGRPILGSRLSRLEGNPGGASRHVPSAAARPQPNCAVPVHAEWARRDAPALAGHL